MCSYELVRLAIADFCDSLSAEDNLVIGLSGGVDSVVLTHAISAYVSKQNLSLQLKTVHVNHGLQKQANYWQQFTEQFSLSLGLPFQSVSVSINAKNRQGLESVARDKRYETLFEECPEKGYLLTAHHRQDQVETVLLNLFRGTGIKGLLGMPESKRVSDKKNIHARPLLNTPLNAILDYARHFDLNWVEDPSNKDTSFRRNFIRHDILPKIARGGYDVELNISRMTNNLAEEFSLLNELAEQDLLICSYTKLALNIAPLEGLSWARKRNVIRFWNDSIALFNVKFTLKLYQWLEDAFKIENVNAHPSKLGKDFQIKVEKKTVYLLRELVDSYKIKLTDFEPLTFGFDEDVIFSVLKKYQGKEQLVIRSLKEEEFADKQLKKMFKKEKVVFWNRKRWPVVCEGNNVLEVIGFKE